MRYHYATRAGAGAEQVGAKAESTEAGVGRAREIRGWPGRTMEGTFLSAADGQAVYGDGWAVEGCLGGEEGGF
jgi:hypothetical protein